jgi:succinyl-CoA synthetase alpha subunit
MRRIVLRNGPHRVESIQRRFIYIKKYQAFEMLNEVSITTHEQPASPGDFTLSLSVDRTSLSPCLTVTPAASPESVRRLLFNFANPEFLRDKAIPEELATFLRLPETGNKSLEQLILKLWNIFKTKEAFVLEIRASLSPEGAVEVHEARFGFDDAAFRSSARQEEVHQLRDLTEEVPEEVEAEKLGIIYVK